MEKLLERAVQHAELIYRVSEESKLLFVSNTEMNLKLSFLNFAVYQDFNLSKYLMKIGKQSTSTEWFLNIFQDEMLISNGMNLHIPEGNMCAPKTVPVPLSKSEIQQISVSSSNGIWRNSL